MKRVIPLFAFIFLISFSFATPALSGFSIIPDKPSYVLGEEMTIRIDVSLALGYPFYNAYVNISFLNPSNQTISIKNCTTNEEGYCYVNFIITGDLPTGSWILYGEVSADEFSANKTVPFTIREMLCGDGVCDLGE